MPYVECCVCEKPIEGQALEMGGRPYCPDCYARVNRNRRSLWWASLLGIGLLVALVALLSFLFGQIRPHLEGPALTLTGVVLALLPALFWLAFFYLQDVREPEPKWLVLGVFLLGALLARAVGLPLIEEVFGAPAWFSAGPVYHLLGAIFVTGFINQFLIYAGVRYTVYNSAEFDERVDGILYGTAAALGYATMGNLEYVVRSGGLDLSVGIIRIAVSTLAMASFGGLLGYFLGRCKFEDEPAWWMPTGLALAALLNGLFVFFWEEVTTTRVGLAGGGFNPWYGLLQGAVVAGLTFALLYYLIYRLSRRAPQAGGL
jgi:RsiW-degrading membrane proteinase PrsW (M82 family)